MSVTTSITSRAELASKIIDGMISTLRKVTPDRFLIAPLCEELQGVLVAVLARDTSDMNPKYEAGLIQISDALHAIRKLQ